MKKCKLRHKILIGLLLAVTAAMVGAYLYSIACYYKPEPFPQLPNSISLKDQILIDTLYFIPVYLAVLLLWSLGVKIIDAINKCK